MSGESMSNECDRFDAQLEELAIGDVSEPARGELLAHAATCRNCRGRLDEMIALTDGLLLLAPQHEPPGGFETRVLDRLGVATSAVPASRRAHRWRRVVGLAAAVVLIAAVASVISLAVGDDASDVSVVSSGVIVNGDGDRTGTVDLVDATHPYALVTIDSPRDRGGVVGCELVLADGTVVSIGTWGYDDVRANVWAAGIAPEYLDAVSMHIVDEDGTVLAIAALG